MFAIKHLGLRAKSICEICFTMSRSSKSIEKLFSGKFQIPFFEDKLESLFNVGRREKLRKFLITEK